ncbi:MAG TPA: hypothetical protein VMB79_08765 [Jatrophihabitans sp.]|nr:hypothetical protein [Jatrophihabitans sp.]
MTASGEPAHVPVTCPECGAAGSVDPTRRDSLDFCGNCDFPLFWARDQFVLPDAGVDEDDSLRRLPGTLGRVEIASVPCPHCDEPNLPSAVVCVRCGLSMKLEPPPPPPVAVPVPVVAPEPVYEPEPPQRMWIWWLLLVAGLLILGVVLVLAEHWY